MNSPTILRTVLSITAMLFALTGCLPAPESSSNVTGNSASNPELHHFVQASGAPEVTAEKIMSDIVGRVIQVAELTGTRPATEWTFEADEFRQVKILERHPAEKGLMLVIFMVTRNNPGPDENAVQVSGKLKLQYEWSAEKWILTSIENLTFRYSVGLST